MLEIKVIIAMLVQRFTLKLVPGQKIVADGITRLPRYGLYMQVMPAPYISDIA
jgi:cytochrome P450